MRVQRCILILLIGTLPVLSDTAIDFTVSDPACDRMIPTHNTNDVQPFGSSNFRLRTYDASNREIFEYDSRNGHLLKVTVEGGLFYRAHIQARPILYPDKQAGTFQEPLPQYFKLANCSRHGNSALNDDFVSRRHGSVMWKPPNIPKGPIVFFATVIQKNTNGSRNQLFHIRSSFLSPKLKVPRVESQGCARSSSCLSVGEDDCLFGESCQLSVKWSCYKDRVLIEGIHKGENVSFGFVRDQNRSVMCAWIEGRAKIEEYVLPESVEHNVYRNMFRTSPHKLLKQIKHKNHVYCRFEVQRANLSNLFAYGGVAPRYGVPNNLTMEKLQTKDLCEPRNFHATYKGNRKPLLMLASLTGDSSCYHCCSYAHHILVIAFLFALLRS